VRLKPLQTQIARHEKRMEELSAQLATLDAQLGSPDAYASLDREQLRGLNERRTTAAAQLRDAEHAWLEASETLEKLQAGGA
jgi:ATP-binding cassette subfamily F protein 3